MMGDVCKVGSRGHTSQRKHNVSPNCSECHPPTRSISITWELAKNAESWSLNQNLPFDKIPSDENLRNVLENTPLASNPHTHARAHTPQRCR